MEDHGARGLHRLDTHHGVPRWMRESYTFCSRCGADLRFGPVPDEERHRLVCDSCGFIAYINPRLVVTTLPVTDDGKVILLRRGIEPGYGAWAQPGGFLEIDETAIQGAVRETLEETGYVVEPSRIVGLYSRPQAGIVVVAFEARVTGGEATTGLEALEITARSRPRTSRGRASPSTPPSGRFATGCAASGRTWTSAGHRARSSPTHPWCGTPGIRRIFPGLDSRVARDPRLPA